MTEHQKRYTNNEQKTRALTKHQHAWQEQNAMNKNTMEQRTQEQRTHDKPKIKEHNML